MNILYIKYVMLLKELAFRTEDSVFVIWDKDIDYVMFCKQGGLRGS